MKLKHFLVVAFAFVAGMASAQQMPAIPIDPNVRIGKLDNGLTYYIRHNNWPENVANFYIAQASSGRCRCGKRSGRCQCRH